jgi:predicted DNA-binding WGR domain protein
MAPAGTVGHMTTSRTTSRKASMLDHLPAPTFDTWGVALHFASGTSNKEYRIVVDGSRTAFQWGRAGASGECQIVDRGTPTAAVAAARKQWAAKEAKGYWPTSGVVPMPALGTSHDGFAVITAIYGGYRDASDRLVNTPLRPGNEPLLCQLPSYDCPGPWRPVLDNVSHVLTAGEATPGAYVLVMVHPDDVAAVRALCPVAVAVPAEGSSDPVAVAEVAAVLAADAGDVDSVRAEFSRVLRAATTLLS